MIEVLIHGFIDTFAAGRSSVKVYLFLVYLFILYSIHFLLKKDHKNNYENNNLNYYLILLGIGYIMGIFTHFWFYIKNHVPLLSYAITFGKYDLSTSSILHNHLTKSGFGLIQKIFLNISASSIDAGSAYQFYIPQVLGITLLLICFLIIFQSIKLFVTLLKDKNHVWIFAYGVITFSLFKNIFDGGVFNYEVLPALILFIFLIEDKLAVKQIKILFYILVAYIISLISILFLLREGILQYFSRMVICFISMGSIVLLTKIKNFNFNKRERVLIYIVLITFIGGVTYTRAVDMISYHQLPIEDKAIVGIVDKDNNIVFKEVNKDKHIGKIADVLAIYDLIDNHIPVTIPWITCLPTDKSTEEEFYLISKNQPYTLKYEKERYTLSLLEKKNYKNMNTLYKGILKVDPCTPLHINIISYSLSKMGFENSILYIQ